MNVGEVVLALVVLLERFPHGEVVLVLVVILERFFHGEVMLVLVVFERFPHGEVVLVLVVLLERFPHGEVLVVFERFCSRWRMIRRRYLVLQRWSLDKVLLWESPLRGLFARPAPSDADAVVVLACCGVGVNQVVHQLGKHPAEMCCGNNAGNDTGGRSREILL